MSPEENKPILISISSKSIIKFFLIILGVALIYLLRDVILIIVVSVVLATALNPWVNALQRKKIPRILATLFIYLAFFGSFIIILVLLIPPIAEQITELTKNFPEYYNRIVNDFQGFQDESAQQNFSDSLQSTLQTIQTSLGQTSAGIFSALSSIFGGFFAFFGVLIITFYMLLEEHALKHFIRSITPTKYQPYVFQLINRSQERLRLWLKGQLILSLIIFVLVYIGLLIFGVEFSLVLALWAGLTEFVPYIGPFIGAIPAVFIAITTGSFAKGVLVLIWYIIVQQLENNLIVPKVMQKTVGLNPLVIIIVMLIGVKLAGMIGLLLAVPLTLIFKVFSEDFFAMKEEKEAKLEG